MNYFNKKNIVILIIAILLIINISTISTIIYLSYTKPPMPVTEIDRKPYTMLKRELNLTEDQSTEFLQIGEAFRERNLEILKDMHENRIAIIDEMGRPEPDQEKLDSLADEVGYLHSQLKRNTINHFLDLKKVCTPDQYLQLENKFRRMIMNEMSTKDRHERNSRYRHGRKDGMNRRER